MPASDGGSAPSSREGRTADGAAPTDGGDAAASLADPDASRAAREQLDDDGNDDPEDPGQGSAPTSGRFEKVGTPPLALTRICDLTPFGDALYAAHAHQPLGTDGATITRYRNGRHRSRSASRSTGTVPGEPAKGGGAGQGFLRVHAIGGRLFVADADPPYNGLGLVEYGTEGYVFVSDRNGGFAPPRAPHYRPPGAPDLLDATTGAPAPACCLARIT